MGVMGKRTGSIRYRERELIRMPSNGIARLGIAWCPEERGIFASLDVRGEPDAAAAGQVGRHADRGDLRPCSPTCKERLRSQGTKLSGGEQQMLAIARILRTGATCCCWTSRPKGWPPSSSSRSAR
jgi:branched-chain amino acid transport system ATP-binding protein